MSAAFMLFGFSLLYGIAGSTNLGEVAKAVQGGATALGDREELRKEINASNSPRQLAGVIQKYQELMAGQLKGARLTYESSGLTDFDKKLTPRTVEILGSRGEGPAGAGAEAKPQIAPGTTKKGSDGRTYIHDGRGWKPL